MIIFPVIHQNIPQPLETQSKSIVEQSPLSRDTIIYFGKGEIFIQNEKRQAVKLNP